MFKPQKRSPALVKKDIIAFLDACCGQVDPKPGKYSCGMKHRTALVLATSYRDVPRATPLEFFHDGLTLYVFGEPGGKIANIKRNQRVAAAVYQQPLDHRKLQKSLQIFGTAELITLRSDLRLFKAKAKKWNLYSVLDRFLEAELGGKSPSAAEFKALQEKILGAITLIKITPDHIILREYRQDFSMPKYEWKNLVASA
ncbi:MAG: pyridoxamine 5'-phosphate oxidase family protein [Deltaproteobacteria bacterium]|nr:pyridoxamine 5'-phosphate oxidase family protein [Deltaproteobacteria bacterium]